MGISTKPEYQRFLNKKELKDALFFQLRDSEIFNFKQLAIAIHRKHIDEETLFSIISSAISEEYFREFNKEINSTKLVAFSKELINSLDSIALLWDKV